MECVVDMLTKLKNKLRRFWQKKFLSLPFCFDCNEPLLDMEDFYDVDLILPEYREAGAMCSRCGKTRKYYY